MRGIPSGRMVGPMGGVNKMLHTKWASGGAHGVSKSLLCAMPTHGSDVRERDLAVGMHRASAQACPLQTHVGPIWCHILC